MAIGVEVCVLLVWVVVCAASLGGGVGVAVARTIYSY